MTVATTVMLVRHGSHGHLGRTMTGRMAGISLSSEGLEEAERLGSRLAHETVAALYVSPLDRARETAQPIAAALGMVAETCEALNEIDMGEWTGASFDTLAADERWHVWNRERAAGCPPGGESMHALEERVSTLLETWRVAHPGRAVIGVTHAEVIKAAVCGCLGLSTDRCGAFDIEPASLTTLVVWEGGGKVAGLNERVRP